MQINNSSCRKLLTYFIKAQNCLDSDNERTYLKFNRNIESSKTKIYYQNKTKMDNK